MTRFKNRSWAQALMVAFFLAIAVGCGDDSTTPPVEDTSTTPDVGIEQDSTQDDTGSQPDAHVHDGGGGSPDAHDHHDTHVANNGDDTVDETDAGDETDAEPDDDAEETALSFSADVWPILGGCIGCHGASGGLNLSAANAYTNLVGVNSGICNGEVRVIAGDSENSYLIKKIEGRQRAGCGNIMHPSVSISATNVAIIRQWIDEGALNN